MPLGPDALVTAGVALLTGGGGVLLGWTLHRSKERATQEEQSRGQLTRLRHDALVATLRGVSEMLGYKYAAQDPEQAKAFAEVLDAEQIKSRMVENINAIMSNVLLLPLPLRKAVFEFTGAAFVKEPDPAKVKQLGRRLACEVEAYLPPLGRREIRHEEAPQP